MTRKTGRGESTSDRGSDSDRERRRDRGSDSDRERRRDRGSDSDRERRRASRKHMTSRRRSPKRNTSHDREPVKRSRRDSPDRVRDAASKVLEKPATKADEKQNEAAPEVPKKKAEETLLTMRTGGAYIPPARLKQMQAEISDKSSMEYQRISWEALKKSLHGLINKVNISNIGVIVRELFKENVVRGRGLLCRSIMQAQSFSPTFSHVYATLVSVINSKFPQTGELLLRRLVIQFRRGFRRNDKQLCLTSTRFIAHLVNQQVAHEVLALEILTLLLETPNEDSVEVAVGFLKECGMKLTAVSPKGIHAIFERLRSVLHEGQLDKRVQYMIEVMFAIRKDGFQDFQSVLSELDLVEESEQFTHLITLDEATNSEDILNVFKFDTEFEENEEKYKGIRKVILDEGSSGSEGSGSESDDGEEEEDSEEEKGNMEIIDNTETNLVALRRTIYLTIQSSLDFEECAHKLLKLELKPGQIIELCHMILDCCAQQRTYEKFYGLLAQRFCQLNKIYVDPFQEIFKTAYDTIHRFETNKLRNVAKFFAHLLYTDAIIWLVLSSIRLNEEDTTSSSRIFIKILFQELCEYMSLPKLNDRVKDPTLQEAFDGLFPRDNPQNTRFAINFFTSIGLGGLTDDLREHLKSIPKVTQPPVIVPQANLSGKEDSSSSDDEHDSSSEDESDESEEEKPKKKKRNKSKRSKAKKKSKHKKKDKKNKTKHLKEVPKVTSNQEHIQRLRSEIQHLEKEQEKLAREKERRRLLEEANKIQVDINREVERERVNRRSPPKAPEERRDAEERLHKSREGPEQDETRSKRDENTDRDRTQDRYQRSKRDEDKDRGRKDAKDRTDEDKEKGKKDLRNHTEEEKDRGKKDMRNHVDEDKDRGKKDRLDRVEEKEDRGRKDRTDDEKERSRKDTKDHSEEKTRGRKDLGERTDEEDRGRKDSRTRGDDKERGRKDPRDRVDEEKDRRRKDQRDHADEEKDRGRKDRTDEERDRGKKDRIDDEKDKAKKGRSDEERDRGKKDTKDRVEEKERTRREVKDHVGEGKNDVKDKTERTRDLPRSIRDRSRERDRQRERVEDSPRKKKAQSSQEERKPKNYEWESSRKSGKSGDRNYSDRKRTRDGRVLAEMKV